MQIRPAIRQLLHVNKPAKLVAAFLQFSFESEPQTLRWLRFELMALFVRIHHAGPWSNLDYKINLSK
jgi:hypothetical protein